MQAPVRTDLGPARRVMWVYVLTGLAVFALMTIVGILMRLEQANWLTFPPSLFYSLMTLHGAGMITGIAIAGMGVLWYAMRAEGELAESTAYWAFALLVLGIVLVLIAVVVGHFGAAWTFLYPLPFVGASWAPWATGAFLIGVMLFTAGYAVWCTQILGFVLGTYGGMRAALGWDLVFHPQAFAAAGKEPPPPAAFAALVSSFDGLLTAAVGTVIGVALIVHWLTPTVQLDPLWAKNLTYFFGHSLANLTIYMAVAAIYVGLPRYAHREYHTSAVLAVAWWGTLVFVLIAYFHHLYMDFVQLRALQYVGEVASYLAALPPAVVTVFGSLLLMYRAAFRWTLGSLFMFAGLVGWIVGGIGALLDATVPFNSNLHNTLWVPAHFHTYLLEGVVLFVLGWAFLMLEEQSGTWSPAIVRWLVALTYFGGGAVFLFAFYLAGADGVPRRYATQPAPGPEIAGWASIGAIILLLGLVLTLVEGLRLVSVRTKKAA